MNDTIFIHGLRVDTIIGCLPHEKTKAQTLIIDVEMRKDFSKVIETDDVQFTVDYAEVAETTRAFVENTHVEMIEKLAALMADMILNTFSISEVTIKIQKPDAIKNLPMVGVIITRPK